MPRSLPEPPPLPHRRPFPLDHCQAACTHTHMTRLYDDYGSHRCHICHRHPNIGWVYRCTQDHDNFLPESDFVADWNPRPSIDLAECEVSLGLSPWINRAIAEDQYTIEQVFQLVQQRQSVRDAIFAKEQTPVPPRPLSSDEPITTTNPEALNSASAAFNQPESTSTAPGPELGEKTIEKTALSTFPSNLGDDVLSETEGRKKPSQSPPSFSICNWKCCHTCRPNYRERAYQSIDKIVSEGYTTPPKWELENRRVSDARLLSVIGLLELHQIPPNLDSCFNSSSEEQLPKDSNAAEDNNRQKTCGLHAFRSKPSFRGSVRKAMKQALKQPRSANRLRCPEKSSKNSSRESFRSFGRSFLPIRGRGLRQSRPRLDYNGRVIEDNQLQDSLMLTIAINTPLPDAAVDAEDLEGGEVEIEDGIQRLRKVSG